MTTTSVTTSAVTSTMRVTTIGAAGTPDAAGAQATSRVASNPVTIPNLTGMKFILRNIPLPPPLPRSGCTPGPRPCRPCANHHLTIVLEAEITFTQYYAAARRCNYRCSCSFACIFHYLPHRRQLCIEHYQVHPPAATAVLERKHTVDSHPQLRAVFGKGRLLTAVSFRPGCTVTSARHGEFGANTLK